MVCHDAVCYGLAIHDRGGVLTQTTLHQQSVSHLPTQFPPLSLRSGVVVLFEHLHRDIHPVAHKLFRVAVVQQVRDGAPAKRMERDRAGTARETCGQEAALPESIAT